jgi:hypothetical protein
MIYFCLALTARLFLAIHARKQPNLDDRFRYRFLLLGCIKHRIHRFAWQTQAPLTVHPPFSGLIKLDSFTRYSPYRARNNRAGRLERLLSNKGQGL